MSKVQFGHNTNTVFYKTLQYADRFNKYGVTDDFEKGSQKSSRLRLCLEQANLDYDEEATLINLLPMKAEEAISIMPSLKEKYIPLTLESPRIIYNTTSTN